MSTSAIQRIREFWHMTMDGQTNSIRFTELMGEIKQCPECVNHFREFNRIVAHG